MKHRTRMIVAVIGFVVAGLVIGPFIDDTPGFVVVVVEKTTYELRLWLAFALMGAFILSLAIIATIARILLRRLGYLRQWTIDRKHKNARQQTIDGMIAFAEGNWQSSEKLHTAAAKQSGDAKMLNYLVAAQSAQQQKASDRRDKYLALAQESQPSAKTAVYLTQAQLQVQEGQLEQAVATLTQLQRDTSSKHKHVLKLLAELYEQLMDWQHLFDLVPLLKKQRVFEVDKLNALEQKSLSGLLHNAKKTGEKETLVQTWKRARPETQRNPEIVQQYVKCLMAMGDEPQAEVVLRDALKREWNDDLALLYGQINVSDTSKQLATAEGWLKQRPNNPKLLVTLGKLCLRLKIWDKAESYLSRAIDLQAEPQAFVYLAQAKENLNDRDAAFNYYKQGLNQAVDLFSATSSALNVPANQKVQQNDVPRLSTIGSS